jgi:hypothetical protein
VAGESFVADSVDIVTEREQRRRSATVMFSSSFSLTLA